MMPIPMVSVSNWLDAGRNLQRNPELLSSWQNIENAPDCGWLILRQESIHSDVLKNTPHCEDLKPEKIKETSVNELLINWHSIDGNYAIEAIRATNGWAENTGDKSLLSYSKLSREREGFNVLPTSTAGLIALLE